MIVLKFDPLASLIRLRAVLESRYKKAAILIFDPGASITAITPQVAEALGCDLESTCQTLSLYTAGGITRAHSLELKSISLYGETLESIMALCTPLPAEVRADGLLGLNFLRHFRINLDFETGALTFDRIKTASS